MGNLAPRRQCDETGNLCVTDTGANITLRRVIGVNALFRLVVPDVIESKAYRFSVPRGQA